MQTVERAIRAVLERAVSCEAPGAVALAGTAFDRTNVVVAGVRKLDGPPVTADTLFDLASLTKVTATLPAVLALASDGALDLDDPVRSFFSNAGWFQEPSLADATVRQLLSHTSGLPAWKPLFGLVSERLTAVANALQTELDALPGTQTTYSDLGFLVLGAIVERVSGLRLDVFAQERVFAPLGLDGIGFRPVGGLGVEQAADRAAVPGVAAGARTDAVTSFGADAPIAATEDCGWRGTLLEGVVHDENAFVMDGVAGHAGLFGTAADVATYAQAWLRATTETTAETTAETMSALGRSAASAPGVVALPFSRILAAECVREHAPSAAPGGPLRAGDRSTRGTTRDSSTRDNKLRRGLGWQLASEGSIAGRQAGERSFGHTGFTGTSMWIDPAAGWFAVLLTNRVHPNRSSGQNIDDLRRTFHDRVAAAIVEHGSASSRGR